jgi:sec-independent protein translocase protein TatB
MFGIGLPEMILILALALIIVGPDKLPDLARSMAKGVMELKKTAETLKKSLSEDGNPLRDIQADLDQTARALNQNLLESDDSAWKTRTPGEGVNPAPGMAASGIVDAEFTVQDGAVAPDSETSQTNTGDAVTEPTPQSNAEKDSPPPPAC